MTILTEYVMNKDEEGPTGLVTFTLSELKKLYPRLLTYPTSEPSPSYVVVDAVDNSSIHFASLEWTGNIVGEEEEYTLLVCGTGCGRGLRELRHTWWGERGCGYLHYTNVAAIAETFRILGEWFDL